MSPRSKNTVCQKHCAIKFLELKQFSKSANNRTRCFLKSLSNSISFSPSHIHKLNAQNHMEAQIK